MKHDAEVKHQYLLFCDQILGTYKYVDTGTRTGPYIYSLGLRVLLGAQDDGPGVGEPWAAASGIHTCGRGVWLGVCTIIVSKVSLFEVDEDNVEMVTDEKLLAEEAKPAEVETGCLCLR